MEYTTFIFDNYPVMHLCISDRFPLPYSVGKEYVLLTHFHPENVCPFEERTGPVDFTLFSLRDSVVTFEREPDNPVDPDAVKILVDGKWVGYFYRTSYVRSQLLRCFRNPGRFYIMGKLENIEPAEGKLRINVGVYEKLCPDEYQSLGEFPLKDSRNTAWESSEFISHFVRAEKVYMKGKVLIKLFNRAEVYIGRMSFKKAAIWDKIYLFRDMRFYIKDSWLTKKGRKYSVEVFVKKPANIAFQEI